MRGTTPQPLSARPPMIAALLLLTVAPTPASAQVTEPGLFYLEPAKTTCRWMLLSLKRRSSAELCRTPCPDALAFDLGARRYVYARGGQVFEGRGARPAFAALPRPAVGKARIERVWLDREGSVRIAYVAPVEKSGVFLKGEDGYYRFEGRAIKLADDPAFFGGMATALRLTGVAWSRVEVTPSFGDPDRTADTSVLKNCAPAPGSHAVQLHAKPPEEKSTREQLVAESKAAAKLIRTAYAGWPPEQVQYLAFGARSGLLYYQIGRGDTGPVYLCRDQCATATRIFSYREDEMGDLQVSRSGDYAWVRYQSDLVVFADYAGSRPILRVKGPAFETWVALTRPGVTPRTTVSRPRAGRGR